MERPPPVRRSSYAGTTSSFFSTHSVRPGPSAGNNPNRCKNDASPLINERMMSGSDCCPSTNCEPPSSSSTNNGAIPLQELYEACEAAGSGSDPEDRRARKGPLRTEPVTKETRRGTEYKGTDSGVNTSIRCDGISKNDKDEVTRHISSNSTPVRSSSYGGRNSSITDKKGVRKWWKRLFLSHVLSRRSTLLQTPPIKMTTSYKILLLLLGSVLLLQLALPVAILGAAVLRADWEVFKQLREMRRASAAPDVEGPSHLLAAGGHEGQQLLARQLQESLLPGLIACLVALAAAVPTALLLGVHMILARQGGNYSSNVRASLAEGIARETGRDERVSGVLQKRNSQSERSSQQLCMWHRGSCGSCCSSIRRTRDGRIYHEESNSTRSSCCVSHFKDASTPWATIAWHEERGQERISGITATEQLTGGVQRLHVHWDRPGSTQGRRLSLVAGDEERGVHAPEAAQGVVDEDALCGGTKGGERRRHSTGLSSCSKDITTSAAVWRPQTVAAALSDQRTRLATASAAEGYRGDDTENRQEQQDGLVSLCALIGYCYCVGCCVSLVFFVASRISKAACGRRCNSNIAAGKVAEWVALLLFGVLWAAALMSLFLLQRRRKKSDKRINGTNREQELHEQNDGLLRGARSRWPWAKPRVHESEDETGQQQHIRSIPLFFVSEPTGDCSHRRVLRSNSTPAHARLFVAPCGSNHDKRMTDSRISRMEKQNRHSSTGLVGVCSEGNCIDSSSSDDKTASKTQRWTSNKVKEIARTEGYYTREPIEKGRSSGATRGHGDHTEAPTSIRVHKNNHLRNSSSSLNRTARRSNRFGSIQQSSADVLGSSTESRHASIHESNYKSEESHSDGTDKHGRESFLSSVSLDSIASTQQEWPAASSIYISCLSTHWGDAHRKCSFTSQSTSATTPAAAAVAAVDSLTSSALRVDEALPDTLALSPASSRSTPPSPKTGAAVTTEDSYRLVQATEKPVQSSPQSCLFPSNPADPPSAGTAAKFTHREAAVLIERTTADRVVIPGSAINGPAPALVCTTADGAKTTTNAAAASPPTVTVRVGKTNRKKKRGVARVLRTLYQPITSRSVRNRSRPRMERGRSNSTRANSSSASSTDASTVASEVRLDSDALTEDNSSRNGIGSSSSFSGATICSRNTTGENRSSPKKPVETVVPSRELASNRRSAARPRSNSSTQISVCLSVPTSACGPLELRRSTLLCAAAGESTTTKSSAAASPANAVAPRAEMFAAAPRGTGKSAAANNEVSKLAAPQTSSAKSCNSPRRPTALMTTRQVRDHTRRLFPFLFRTRGITSSRAAAAGTTVKKSSSIVCCATKFDSMPSKPSQTASSRLEAGAVAAYSVPEAPACVESVAESESRTGFTGHANGPSVADLQSREAHSTVQQDNAGTASLCTRTKRVAPPETPPASSVASFAALARTPGAAVAMSAASVHPFKASSGCRVVGAAPVTPGRQAAPAGAVVAPSATAATAQSLAPLATRAAADNTLTSAHSLGLATAAATVGSRFLSAAPSRAAAPPAAALPPALKSVVQPVLTPACNGADAAAEGASSAEAAADVMPPPIYHTKSVSCYSSQGDFLVARERQESQQGQQNICQCQDAQMQHFRLHHQHRQQPFSYGWLKSRRKHRLPTMKTEKPQGARQEKHRFLLQQQQLQLKQNRQEQDSPQHHHMNEADAQKVLQMRSPSAEKQRHDEQPVGQYQQNADVHKRAAIVSPQLQLKQQQQQKPLEKSQKKHIHAQAQHDEPVKFPEHHLLKQHTPEQPRIQQEVCHKQVTSPRMPDRIEPRNPVEEQAKPEQVQVTQHVHRKRQEESLPDPSRGPQTASAADEMVCVQLPLQEKRRSLVLSRLLGRRSKDEGSSSRKWSAASATAATTHYIDGTYRLFKSGPTAGLACVGGLHGHADFESGIDEGRSPPRGIEFFAAEMSQKRRTMSLAGHVSPAIPSGIHSRQRRQHTPLPVVDDRTRLKRCCNGKHKSLSNKSYPSFAVQARSL